MKKALILLIAALLLAGCGNAPKTENTPAPTATSTVVVTTEPTPEPTQTATRFEIPAIDESAADGLNEVSSVDCSLISNDTFETVTLYTSASKENGRFVWDDHAKWCLEITSDTGSVYSLYDNYVSNGSIYFDIIDVDNQKYVLVRNISTASDYTKVFTFESGKLYETNELNLNEMKDMDVNLIFTSTPSYR